MNEKDTIAKLLHLLADSIEQGSPTDVEALLTGRATLAITTTPPATEQPGKREPQKQGHASKRDLPALVDQLRQLSSRDDGLTLLNQEQLNKKELEELARCIDLPVVRTDDAERLRQKIIEETIGARLNSQAIRGR
jgi:hypothetical protein